MSTFFLVLGAIGALIGTWAGSITVMDAHRSRAVQRTRTFPIEIRRSIRFRDYVAALELVKIHLDEERRFVPDIVVGIHYGGIASAADVGRRFYKPLYLMTTHISTDASGNPVCDKVQPKFNKSDISGRRVLLIDNRVKSGRTLSMSRDKLIQMGAKEVFTLVIYRPAESIASANLILFAGTRNLRDLLS